jgi:threonine/homoserine/homoserine lactone efflux protein
LEEAKLFLVIFIAAFVGVLPPGLVNLSVAKTCLEKGKSNGLLLSVGAALIVFVQATVAIMLSKYIFDHPYVNKMLLRTGVVIFGILAIYFFIKAKKKHTNLENSTEKGVKSFLKGMMISALNVFPIPFFVAVSTAMNAKGRYEYDFNDILVFALGAMLGSFCVYYIYAICFLKIEKHTDSVTKYSNYFMAFLMVALVIITLFRIYYPWK